MKTFDRKSLVKALLAFDAETASRSDFTVNFQSAVRSLEMNTEQLAKLLDTTTSTINRWKSGRNTPTRSLRKLILRDLANEIF